MVGELIRKKVFWTLDKIKGGSISSHYNDIKYIYEQRDGYEERKSTHLKNLLDYAVTNSPYYKEYEGYEGLSDFPIIDKQILRDSKNELLSNLYKNNNLHKKSTSGSTGTPLIMEQNQGKRDRVLAELIFFGEKAGFYVGDRNAFLRVWTKENRNSRISLLKKNMIEIDVLNLNDKALENFDILLRKDKKLKCISAYASSLDQISRYLEDNDVSKENYNVETIISTAELLKENTRKILQNRLGCQVVSRYSNQENGILAQEDIKYSYFLINDASYYIEFLKLNSNKEAKPGELARIVVTDLFNYATPVIRYDTGDLCRYELNWNHKIVIKNIEGRILDFIYDTSGNMLSSHVISRYMADLRGIEQYQFIQKGKNDYLFKINMKEKIYKDNFFVERFKGLLGNDANINIEHVSGIPLLNSGKYRHTICEYEPKK